VLSSNGCSGSWARQPGPGNSKAVPTWLITGTDAAGVAAASNALTQSTLANHFELAVHDSTDYHAPYQR